MFALGTFAAGAEVFVGMVLGDRVTRLATVEAAWREAGRKQEAGHRQALTASGSLLALIERWDEAFPLLEAMAAFAEAEGDRLESAALAASRPRPPLTRPGKILHSAANFREHVAEMAGYNAAAGSAPAQRFSGEKQGARPYLFLSAPSALNGAYDDIILPTDAGAQIDWEAELAVIIGRRGRAISANKARAHIAGYVTANDVSRRDALWRADRPNFKTDWLASKSADGFLPMGPVFVPSAFVPDPHDLAITLRVNGAVKQSGSTGEMIFSAEEQIEFASRFMTLEPGDVFVTGTVGGVGQGSGVFLQAGDVMETEVQGIGLMRNRIVAGE